MNDIKRAIAILRDGDWWDHLHFETPDAEGAYNELSCTLDVAIAALQAQLDREREPLNCKGCIDFEENDRLLCKCDECKRMIRTTDCYRTRLLPQPPEEERV